MFHNWISHLNAVAPRWPLRGSEPLISLALILLYWFLPPYKLCLSLLEPTVSFCTATIKKKPWKQNIPPGVRVVGFEIISSYVPVFSLWHWFIVLCCSGSVVLGHCFAVEVKLGVRVTYLSCVTLCLVLQHNLLEQHKTLLSKWLCTAATQDNASNSWQIGKLKICLQNT